MSALSQSIARAASNAPHVAQVTLSVVNNDPDVQSLQSSPQSSCSVLTDSSSGSSQPSTSSAPRTPPQLNVELPRSNDERSRTRPNEHLAVSMPKQLWKADSLASNCDSFYCQIKFSFFERKHHCRKCGGIFCQACTSRFTPLLDTSNLPFLNPPRNVPIYEFETPYAQVTCSRVCDDCWDQLHGCPSTPRTPELVRPSLPIVLLTKRPLSDSGTSSPVSESPRTPPNANTLGLVVVGGGERKSDMLPSLPLQRSLSRSSNPDLRRRVTLRSSHLPLLADEERSYGELDSYPLCRSSVLCKATGGGRWEPKQDPVLQGYRVPVPGGKAPYELEMERQMKRERRKRENPVIKDGEFQYRFPREPEPEPTKPSRSLSLSTF